MTGERWWSYDDRCWWRCWPPLHSWSRINCHITYLRPTVVIPQPSTFRCVDSSLCCCLVKNKTKVEMEHLTAKPSPHYNHVQRLHQSSRWAPWSRECFLSVTFPLCTTGSPSLTLRDIEDKRQVVFFQTLWRVRWGNLLGTSAGRYLYQADRLASARSHRPAYTQTRTHYQNQQDKYVVCLIRKKCDQDSYRLARCNGYINCYL